MPPQVRFNYGLNFLTCVTRRHYQDIRTELTAALTAERITTTVIRGGHLGHCLSAPHSPYTMGGENEREPSRDILKKNYFKLFLYNSES